MDRFVVIANPVASQFTGGSHRGVMAALDRVSEVEAVWPGSPTEASELARQAADDETDVVVAMGGDGLVHHVAQGLVESDTALGVIPVGTTNVFARLLGIPTKPNKAIKLLTSRTTARALGVARLRLTRGKLETTHHSVFACGFGLDAAVVREADKDPYRKYRFGSLHYARTALGVALKDFPRRRPRVTIKSGDRESLVSGALIQFRDVYTYLGKIELRLAPGQPDPMLLLAIERMPRRRIPTVIAAALRKRDLGSIKGMETWTGVESMEFSAETPVAVQADGEALGVVDRGIVVWLPDSLLIVAPQPTEPV
jgi:diacylglycerol kinase family enzyme